MALRDEFKAFIMRGNVIDLAVGMVVGTAFSGIVQAADMGDYGGHGDARLANAADEGVVNIDEYGFGTGRIHVRLPEKRLG